MKSSPAERLVEPRRRPAWTAPGCPPGDQRPDLARRPASSISSRSAATGSSPPNSGSPRTRDCQRAEVPAADRGRVPTTSMAGVVNIAPPSRSRLPVTMLSSWIAHWQSAPNSLRRDARSGRRRRRRRAAANSRAMRADRRRRRRRSAARPRSGVKCATAARTSSRPSAYAGSGRSRPSANRTLSIASRNHASVPGPDEEVLGGDLGGLGAARVEDDHAAAARLQLAQPAGEVGGRHQRAVRGHRVGAEDQEVAACGRCRGSGSSSWWPNIRCATSWCGSWSTEVALKRLRVRSALTSSMPCVSEPEAVHVGVAEVDADRVAAVRVDRSRASRSATRSRASSQAISLPSPVAGRGAPGRRAGRGRRGYPRCATPLGQMCPRDSGSSGLPRTAGDRAVLDGQLEAADRLAQIADTDLLLRGHPRIFTLPTRRRSCGCALLRDAQ